MATLLLAGCAPSGPPPDDGLSPPVIAQSVEPDGFMEALIEGEVVLAGGCLSVRVSIDGHPTDHAIMWPYGTRRNKDDVAAVDVPGAGTFAVGDYLRAGGGFIRHEQDEDDPFTDCAITDEFVVINPDVAHATPSPTPSE
ncbi:hypothetical protein [Antribacter gilvus]|uniref:hypothetical protein n=1 Tax=Antribacter gilvus TaxID=2304675 RepID=UPI0013DF2FB0|nr:hypothetical protein [Antribacter gilvus]